VELSDADRELWASAPPSRAAVPVLLYRDVAPEDFARQMVLLDHAGYETIELDDFVRFVKGQEIGLPPRPLLLTFDGGRLDSWRRSDAILRDLDFNAVMFVNVGCVEEGDPECLTWDELERLQAGGRWDVQLQSGTGGRRIKYGPAPGDVGPFYAYRGSEEVLGGWRERVFSDITYGEQQLSRNVEGYRPLAFAPPYGNYGQAGTNDPRIPRELLARLELSFDIVFTQDRNGFARPGSVNPLGRIEITRDLTHEELHALLACSTPQPAAAARPPATIREHPRSRDCGPAASR
jgi:peptidoglycan/xylan/chitin deacetylase (PgdA/CDA1 family)